MELFSEFIIQITPNWSIALGSIINAILLFYRQKLKIDSYSNYTLHAIGLLLSASFYILIGINTHLGIDSTFSRIAMVRITIIWQLLVWTISSLLNIWENHGHH